MTCPQCGQAPVSVRRGHFGQIPGDRPSRAATGDICLAWVLFWQAGIATKRLDALFEENRIDSRDRAARDSFLSRDEAAAFYDGKVHSARYFIKNVLPQADAIAAAIRSEDMSIMSIHDGSF